MNSQNQLQTMNIRTWLALIILALSTFTIVTTELAPVGLLSPMANGLNVSESQIGMTVSFYAWVGAISALIASIFLGNVPKKWLLIILTLILFCSNILTALVDSYSILLIARVIGALAHGAFWAMIGATAVALVPSKYIGVATSIVFGGVSAASVFGVPLSNYIGINLGWREAFWFMSGLSLVTFIGILILVPNISSNSTIGLSSLKKVLKSSTLWKIYSATLLTITAHFAAFTYIEPLLHSQSLLKEQLIPLTLFIFGLAGLFGNFITGLIIDKNIKLTVSISILLIFSVLTYIGIHTSPLSLVSIVTLVIIWGLSVSGIFVGFQTWVLKLSGDDVFPASSMYVSFFNIAIGIGATLGAWIVAHYPISSLYLIAGIAIGLSLFLVALIPSSAKEIDFNLENEYETN
ncbi:MULTISPECIES: MFS transporter [Acinetobacter]|uniref:MFS transporter n=1 Tax=Acinetobacter TaxID=469 RepID=UPI00019AE2C2|nr:MULTISPECIES: MFS transporter [Acinetobacter]EEH67449.1 transporter, major facilitator family protein [Acinetobacter sp. ATCC 27244]NAS08971.1 MFS transporter [Acinetobacter haemolyticus]SUU21360.1 MFS superfamily arabinose exporter [Acinetobacter haemolyticus]